MSEKEKQVKNHKETLIKVLFDNSYYHENDNGDKFPKNRIQVNLYKYSGENKNRISGNYDKYEGEKIKIINSKLQLEKGNTEIKKKIINGRIYNDETTVVLSKEHLKDILIHLEESELY